ncbi:fatty acid-binding protein 2, liver-like [Glandiceps talaboti]
MSHHHEMFAGKWSFVRAENMDPLLDAIHAPHEAKELAKSHTPSIEISMHGHDFTIKADTSKGMMHNTFKLNEPFEQKYGIIAGKSRQAMATMEGHKLIIKGMGHDPIDQVVETREIHGDEMVVTWTMGDIHAKRWYHKM